MSQSKELLDDYRRQIELDFPELTIAKIRRIGGGWDHVALEVNNSIIFREPKDMLFNDEQRQRVAYETAVLRKLRASLPVAIPDPQYIAPQAGYFGYPKLNGVLAESVWSELTADQHTRFREDWVRIVMTIEQNISAEEARQFGVISFWLEEAMSDTRRLLELDDVQLRHKEFATLALRRAEQLDVRTNALFLHNDFYPHNILLDPKTKKLVGILDWSDCCLAPIEREFALWHSFPPPHLDAMISPYSEKTGRPVNKQLVKSWAYIEACGDLYSQLIENDQAGIKESLRHIDRWSREEGLLSTGL